MKYTLNFFMMMVFSVAFAGSVEGDFNQSKAFIKSLGNQAYQAAKGLNQDDIPKDKNGKELSIYERAQNKKIDIIDLSKRAAEQLFLIGTIAEYRIRRQSLAL